MCDVPLRRPATIPQKVHVWFFYRQPLGLLARWLEMRLRVTGNCHRDSPPHQVAEVEDLLKNVDPTKSTGSDGIPGLVLRQSAPVIAPTLQIIFNTSLRSGYVPKSFKLSHVSPLYKSGDKATASNYRPVSLLPIVSRLLETIVKSTLVGYRSALTCYLRVNLLTGKTTPQKMR